MNRGSAYLHRNRSRLAELVDGRAELPPERPQVLQRGPVLARITSSAPLGGTTRRSVYQWVEAWVVGDTGYAVDDKPGGLSGEFVSALEFGNSASVINPGVDPANLLGTYDLQPLSGYALLFPLRSSTGRLVWVAGHPGAIDGECPVEVMA